MTKEEFVTAAKNVAMRYSNVNLPVTTENLIKKEGCTYFFYWELESEYVDNDDNDVECTYWFAVSAFTDNENVIELATGIDGRRGDHFLVDYKDWL